MKKNIFWVLFCTLIWAILHESFALNILVSGLGLSVLVIFLHQRFLSLPRFVSYTMPLRVFIIYPFILLRQILKSGLLTCQIILKKEAHPAVVMVPSRLKNEWAKTLVANSITLTPGTVSIDFDRHKYIVLWIAPKGQTPEDYYEQIAAPFEKMLLKGEEHA